MTDTDLTAVLDGIHAAVHELADPGGLIDQLRELTTVRTAAPPEVLVMGSSPGSRPPWDARVATVYTSIQSWARHTEADLGTYVHGRYFRRLGGSDRATKDALGNVGIFCDHERVPAAEVVRVARGLGTLLRQAQSVPGIDTAPPAATVLAKPCPVCGTGELEADVDLGLIACTNDVCTTPNGERPSWSRATWPALIARLQKVTP